ncbi:hypothetical protein D5R55_28835 [Burkholderia cenocepacia]|uniref:Uncharacterized protein n=1 Tax=Burkholderia cenocepacia TaxID=95486 RepID=A0A3Q9F836_9BURK|nr:hypothetical protein D5R55_28835 [Burkholderia cenocepacia]
MADRTNPDDITHRRCHAFKRPDHKETVGFFTRQGVPRPTPARHTCFNSETCRSARQRGIRDARMLFPFAFKCLPNRPARARHVRHVSFLRLPSARILVCLSRRIFDLDRKPAPRQGRARIRSAKALKTRIKCHSEMFRM